MKDCHYCGKKGFSRIKNKRKEEMLSDGDKQALLWELEGTSKDLESVIKEYNFKFSVEDAKKAILEIDINKCSNCGWWYRPSTGKCQSCGKKHR